MEENSWISCMRGRIMSKINIKLLFALFLVRVNQNMAAIELLLFGRNAWNNLLHSFLQVVDRTEVRSSLRFFEEENQ